MKTNTTDYFYSPVLAGNNSVTTPKQKTGLASYPLKSDADNEICPFRRLVRSWIISCRADGLSTQTLEDYQEKLFKFWWWWTSHTDYSRTKGQHPKNVTKREYSTVTNQSNNTPLYYTLHRTLSNGGRLVLSGGICCI